MNTKLAELKKGDPALKHSEAYEQAFAEWKVRLARSPSSRLAVPCSTASRD